MHSAKITIDCLETIKEILKSTECSFIGTNFGNVYVNVSW
jgi:hypothetical protein